MYPISITTFRPILLTFVITSSLYGQVDSALGFFPLNSGDIHQYNYHYSVWGGTLCTTQQAYSSYCAERILRDTVLPNGHQYKIVNSNEPLRAPFYYLRIDSATANVYGYDPWRSPIEFLVDSLRSTQGSMFIREGWYPTECMSVDTATVLGTPTVVKRFRCFYIFGEEYILAYGLGRIQTIYFWEDGCRPALNKTFLDIVYARIDSTDHGIYVGVSQNNEEVPASNQLIRNYPNPFNGETTFELSIETKQHVRIRVFNSLGQELMTILDDDVLAGNQRIRWAPHNLASGVYYYRVETNTQFGTGKMLYIR